MTAQPTGASVGDLLRYLLPEFETARPTWPPDAFAVAAALLRQSGAYTTILQKWPRSPHHTLNEWGKEMERLREQWREVVGKGEWPDEVGAWWETVLSNADLPLQELPDRADVVQALISIVAAADQTCWGFGNGNKESIETIELQALDLLTKAGTLCREIHPSRAVVLPKLHNPLNGLTLRSLTHNLALWDRTEVRPKWNQFKLKSVDHGCNVLLLPWPLEIAPKAFQPYEHTEGCAMPKDFGFFTYASPDKPFDPERVLALKAKATQMVGPVDVIIFPELSLAEADFEELRRRLTDTLIIAGIGEAASGADLGKNEVRIALGPLVDRQSKHHRWRLDEWQVSTYGLGRALGAPKKWWWEAIHVPERSCSFFTVNEWLTLSVLICEDLARQDPVGELVRSVGPNLVVALLMDGPQIPERWSARYATVLAEDPRSSVLTLTNAGMVDLARSQRGKGPRSVGLWKDALMPDTRQIELDQGADAVVLSLSKEKHKEWTIDGRHDGGSTGYLKLMGVHQVSLPRARSAPKTEQPAPETGQAATAVVAQEST